MVALVSHYFEMLNERMLDGVLELYLLHACSRKTKPCRAFALSGLLKLVEDNVKS